MMFKKYDNYKESGLEWLGDIPSEWGVKRLKDLGDLQNGLSKDGNYFGKGFPFVSYGNIYNDTINLSDIKGLANSNKEDQKIYSVLENDIFFTRTSETIDEIGFSATCLKTIPKATFSGFTIRFRPRFNNLYKIYSKYFFKVHSNRFYFVKNMNIVTRASLNQGLLGKFPTLIPPIKTQTKIATYLDTQTQKIDKEIELLEKKSLKYKELKQTLINETVLRGLDKSVKLKNSGMEWIGDIPEGWETERIKNIFNERVGKNLDKKKNEAVTKNILSVMKDIGVINHRDKGNVGNKMAEDITNYKLVYPNDIVVNKMNIMIGSVGISKEFGALSVIYIILITKNNSYAKYYDYFFKMKAFHKSLRKIATGILEIREAVNMTLFMQTIMTKPPLKEQTKIATYLDEKTQKIDAITKTITTKITLLKEFRKTLINDVVTGKVKI